MKTAYTAPAEPTRDETWDFGVERSESEEILTSFVPICVQWQASSLDNIEIEQLSSTEEKVAALIKQERLMEAQALSEGSEGGSTGQGHVVIEDMLSMIKEHRDAASAELFSRTFSKSSLMISYNENIASAVS